MPGTFISYRREDAAGYAGRLRESLERRLGASRVFRDVDTLQPGQDFVKAIEARLADCKVMLVIIGREWVDARNAAGARRLDDPFDFVRLEVAAGLARPDVLVVPVLVEEAPMPSAAQLPDNLQTLARRHAVSVRDETWDADVDRLVSVVDKVVPPSGSLKEVARAMAPKTLAVFAAAIVLLFALALWLPSGRKNEATTPPATSVANNLPAVATTPYTIDIPRVAEAAFADVIYTLVSGNVAAREQDSELRLRVRASNFGRNGINFWDQSFRLTVGGRTVAPVSGLNQIVDGNSLRYGIVAFRVPRQTRDAVFQIVSGNNTASIPIDLTSTGRPPLDEQAEIPDSLSQAIMEPVVREPAPLIDGGGLTVTLDRATSRRFVNALRLIVSVRVVNNGLRPASGSTIVMRVAAGDALVAPGEWPFAAIDPKSSTIESIVFDLPVTATDATLKTTIQGKSAELPVRFSR